MLGLDLIGRFDFNSDTGITYYGINLYAGICSPVREFFCRFGIAQISDNLLNDQMFKGVPEFIGTAFKVCSAQQVVYNTNIELVEAWSLY